MTDIMTPALGESVTEATVARWAKKPGEAVKRDELLVELETDKVSLEVVAPEDGVLSEINAAEGDTVIPGQRLGRVGAGVGAAAASAPEPAAKLAPAPVAAPAQPLSPSVQRIVVENALDPATIKGEGRDGRITKADALAAADAKFAAPPTAPIPSTPAAVAPVLAAAEPAAPIAPPPPAAPNPREERVRMTRLRQTIARGVAILNRQSADAVS